MKSNIFSRRLWSRDFILINLMSCLVSYPTSILQSILPVHVLNLGGSNALTGLMITGLTVLMMLTNLVTAPIVDRFGRKKLLVLGSGLYFINTLLFCFTSDLTWIFVLRVLCGLTTGILFPIPPVVVSDVSPDDLLVDAMGIFGASCAITFAVAPSIGLALYETFGPTALFASAAVVGGAGFVLTWFIGEHYERPAEKVQKTSSKLSKAMIVVTLLPMLVYAVLNFNNSAVGNFLTPCGLSRGLQGISLYFIVNQGVCIAARLLLGRALGFMSKKTCTCIGILLAAVGTAIIAVADNMALMLLSAVLVGLGVTAVTQIYQAESFAVVPSDRKGLASIAFILLGNVGSGAGATVWGALSTGAGYFVTYLLAGASALIGFVFHALYWKKVKNT